MQDSPAIRFKARLLRPAADKRATWTFLVLPKAASAKLGTRASVAVAGKANGHPFRATLVPDGRGSHWLRLTRKQREGAGAKAGDAVVLEVARTGREPEARVPSDLRKALAAAPKAKALWADITPAARRDWIDWVTSAKMAETRVRRVAAACDMLAKGKRRICCFDRSGMYGGNFCAPEAAD
jgi:hypothetical protein